MKAFNLRTLLVFLVLLNVGVLLALGWNSLERERESLVLVDYLKMDAKQVQQWQQAEAEFLLQLSANDVAIMEQRNTLIEAIFAEQLQSGVVEQARLELARRQNRQQEIVVEQLLLERQILTVEQRHLLQELLQRQPTHLGSFGQLHQ